MRFKLALLAVQDVERSKEFYCGLFDQQVAEDYGENVVFSGGFSIQEKFDWLTGVPAEQIRWRAHTGELYFECQDLEAFIRRADGFGVVYLHPPKTYSWRQRVVRIYDPDGHIIEIGESMDMVIDRCLLAGASPQETAAITQQPLATVIEHQRRLAQV